MTETKPPCTISVVIAWVNSYELLTAGLDELLAGNRPADEVIVVTRRGEKEQIRLRENYPNVIVIAEPIKTSITKLRSIGVRRSTGSVVIITEDHCVPSKNWLEIVEQRIAEGYDVIGGPVENSWDKRWRDSAAFLTEYSFAILPADENAQTASTDGPIPGNNAAYRRELVDGLCQTLDADLWESFYHEKLRSEGKKLIYDPEMLLFHHRPFDFFYFISQRYHFCRSFAEMRNQSLSWSGRIKYGLGCAILPPFLWLRGLQTLMKKQRMVGHYLICSPMISIYLFAGAFGEMIGYFLGGGKSLARVE